MNFQLILFRTIDPIPRYKDNTLTVFKFRITTAIKESSKSLPPFNNLRMEPSTWQLHNML